MASCRTNIPMLTTYYLSKENLVTRLRMVYIKPRINWACFLSTRNKEIDRHLMSFCTNVRKKYLAVRLFSRTVAVGT